MQNDPVKTIAAELCAIIKARSEELGALVAAIEQHVSDQHEHAKACDDFFEMERLDSAAPFDWIAQARMSLRSGLMFAERALQQPAGF